MTFEEWFHKEYEPSDLQIKQYAKRKEGLHIPAELYLEDIQKAYEAGQKDSETQIEKMKCCSNCNHFNKESDIEYCQNCERHLVNSLDNFPREEIIKDEWELRR